MKKIICFLALFFAGCSVAVGPSVSVSKNLGYENKPAVGVTGQVVADRGLWANVVSLDASLSQKVQTGDGWGGSARYETGLIAAKKFKILAGVYAHYQYTSVYDKAAVGPSLGLYAFSPKLTYGIRYDFPEDSVNETSAVSVIFQTREKRNLWRVEWALVDIPASPERGMRIRASYLFPLDKKW